MSDELQRMIFIAMSALRDDRQYFEHNFLISCGDV